MMVKVMVYGGYDPKARKKKEVVIKKGTVKV